MLEALGCGDITPAQLISALAPPQPDPEALPGEAPRPQRSGSRAAVTVAGVDNLMTQFAGCCRPLPGDGIAGYVTGGRGVSVHRADCSKLRALALASPARILEVAWQGEQPRQHAVAAKVVAHDRPGLLRDLVNLLGNERINVLDLGTSVDRHRRTATVRLVIELGSLVALGRVLGRIQQIDGVISASRHLE
jgi:GTP pyrophosphokinase